MASKSVQEELKNELTAPENTYSLIGTLEASPCKASVEVDGSNRDRRGALLRRRLGGGGFFGRHFVGFDGSSDL